jgi:uncharacterized membrane protein YgdD (TMEM256/DUF423 family)
VCVRVRAHALSLSLLSVSSVKIFVYSGYWFLAGSILFSPNLLEC